MGWRSRENIQRFRRISRIGTVHRFLKRVQDSGEIKGRKKGKASAKMVEDKENVEGYGGLKEDAGMKTKSDQCITRLTWHCDSG